MANVLELAPTPLGDAYLPPERHPELLQRYPLDVMLCLDCGHVQLSVLVNPEEIYGNYIYATSHSLGLAEHFRRYADKVCDKLKLAPGSFVVDIGSNDGTLLRAFKAKGMRVLGVDPAREIARQAAESGIPTINNYFTPALAEQIRREHGSAALVIANNVIANVPNPGEFFAGVRDLMDSTGNFVWETGYVRYLTEDCVFDNVHHEHIDYYAVRPLTQFYGRMGLELFDVEITESKGSSLRCFVRRAAGAAMAQSVREVVEREERLGYFSPGPYQRLSKRLALTRQRLIAMLDVMREQGKVVAGYGAAIGSTTVLHHFEIGRHLSFLVDDNPVRLGLAAPGTGLRVVGPDTLKKPGRPDVAVILAWRYAAPIIERNRSFLEQGGQFVKILPEIETIGGPATA
jgi:hypothetical protein